MTFRAYLISYLLFCAACNAPPSIENDSGLSSEDVLSGYAFLTAETQILQDDDFSNPGYFWVERGEHIFSTGEKSCRSCHADALKGAAATFPKLTKTGGRLTNLEGQINYCRQTHQSLPELAYESEELLALTAFIAHQSKGVRSSIVRGAKVQKYFKDGREYFYSRRGQLNLSCHNCHDEHWGKKLRGDTISQGHGNGFPAYRFEWQSLGSLHRRFRDCDAGVRAEPLPFGSEQYIALELYLTVRSGGLALEAPAVRR